MTTTTPPALLTYKQAGERLGRSEDTVRNRVKAGLLEAVHEGRHPRISEQQLADYIERLERQARRESQRSVAEAVKQALRGEGR